MTEIAPLSLVAIIGSLRRDSFHRSIFQAATGLLPEGVQLNEVPIAEVPLYNGDVEAAGDPDSVTILKESVDNADGLILFTPEYNRSIPAVTKNAIDWLSRMPGESPLSRATVGIVASSPGGHEVTGVRQHLADSVGANTAKLYSTSLGIASIVEKLTDGTMTDEETRENLRGWLAGFVDHARNVD